MIHSLSPSRPSIQAIAAVLGFAVILTCGLPATAQQTEKAKQTRPEKPVLITEEIQVIGQAPKDQPIATVTRIDFTRLERNRPLDLSEAIRYTPGVSVTVGNKSEFTLKLRGIDSRRIVLLIDGVPSYDPYYGSFDLKTVSAAGIDSLQVTKGPSSVLYGSNTLGGIVNVITRRPAGDPYLTLNGSFGRKDTRTAGFDTGFQWKKFSFAGTLAYQNSDGFAYPDPATGDDTDWTNTDYRRFNANAKIYYAPSGSTEIMVNGSVYTSDYGMPAALGVQKARFWRFKNWDRYACNAGAFTALGENSFLRFRTFFVNYRNTLDQYKDKALSSRQFESTFDNSVFGGFALADLGLAAWNSLKVSLNFQRDIARSQDDLNLPFVEYGQGTFSAAVEDHWTLNDRWKLIAGLSLDVIDKHVGPTASRFNPLLGIKFTPLEELDLHLSFSRKSRLPNMRSLYSSTSGNPDLLSESGTNAELGMTWNKGVFLSAAVFAYEFKDMIDSVNLPDGARRYWNVGRAAIRGAEIQVQKTFGIVEGILSYTFLDHRNKSDDRPLDALSPHNFNFEVSVHPLTALRLGVYGLYASASNWFDSATAKVLTIPDYFNLDAVASYDLKKVQLFIKATNLLNEYLYSEPIFPWRGRFFEIGARVKVF